MVDWSGGVFASCITPVQLYVNACNWMGAVCAAASLALANQLPLPRLYSALVRSSRKLRYIRIRPLPLPLLGLMSTQRIVIDFSTVLAFFISDGRKRIFNVFVAAVNARNNYGLLGSVEERWLRRTTRRF